MWIRRSLSLLGCVAVILAIGIPAKAEPPLGEMGGWWYEGLWSVSVEYKCYRHTDGKKVNLPEQKFYMVLSSGYYGGPSVGLPAGSIKNGSEAYWATFYRDKKLSEPIGGAFFYFDYPGGETHLLDTSPYEYKDDEYLGNLSLYVRGELWANCSFEMQGVLKTFVERAREGMSEKEMDKLRRGSEIKGWDLSWCCQYLYEPKLYEEKTCYKCKSTWKAQWLEDITIEDNYID